MIEWRGYVKKGDGTQQQILIGRLDSETTPAFSLGKPLPIKEAGFFTVRLSTGG